MFDLIGHLHREKEDTTQSGISEEAGIHRFPMDGGGEEIASAEAGCVVDGKRANGGHQAPVRQRHHVRQTISSCGGLFDLVCVEVRAHIVVTQILDRSNRIATMVLPQRPRGLRKPG